MTNTTNAPRLTNADFDNAGAKAGNEYQDEWFACDVAEDKPTEPGTVITEYKGIKFEVWLERTWREANVK